MQSEHVIEAISNALCDHSAVRGLFLSGSFGNGRADAYSDIDFVLVSEHGPTDEVAGAWKTAVERTGDIVMCWDRSPRPALINAITADWTRTDVIILKPEQFAAHSQASLRPLFDHDGLYGQLPKEQLRRQTSPAHLFRQIEEFIRILGLLHLAAGREEYINGVAGIFHLRTKLIELLVEETAAPDRGGALHLNRLLTDEQKALLTALPAPVAEREAMIATHLAYAKAYLPRARTLAKQRGVDWPERFEAATWEKLNQALDVERPYEL
ncbi:nucleotidyltransferase domain-containing protein [Marinovum sp. 2_MG-2023]|uniref:nucleotidyltransferase domain-containing protein n=1 Tax=unclassified Marinovum TaxID=2647166 RepID=UPI0026E27F4D|nr:MULTISPECIES: nucleotidyltransferase domain-containing protein [unclassified Marinovum]MDO6732165.1 nucleotidyltransferase domain-containing protein [Marinovum sp. 2_MG-2023]MDO6781482.1 nucleotidyltransferase domain-containing protein [Marinovum sp. 1_MG-2023]